MLIGEAGGRTEGRKGVPFCGEAGYELDRLLQVAKIDREQCRIVNTVMCSPPNDWLVGAPWEESGLRHCRPQLDAFLSEKHKVVVPLGGTALRAVMNLPRARGKEAAKVQDFHGAPVRDPRGFWVCPTYHPSFNSRSARKYSLCMNFDLTTARELAEGKWEADEPELVIDPSPEWFSRWTAEYLAGDHSETLLAVDIETPDKQRSTDESELGKEDKSYQILYCNFACSDRQGITVPWVEPYVSICKRLIEGGGALVFHNANYDVRRLRAAGVHIDQSRIHDSMDAWHVLYSSLPRGLGFVAPFFCLAAGERVRLWNGKSIKVSDLVTTKADVEVLGCDDNGAPIPLKITNWFRAEQKGQKWLAVKVSNAAQTLHCTPEHKVWTTNVDWQEAQALKPGDRVPLPRAGNNSLIHGTLLGDARVDSTGYLSFSHTDKDAAWTMEKAEVFAPEWKRRGGPTIYHRKAQEGAIRSSNGKTYAYKADTQTGCGVSVGKWWHERFYTPEGKLFIPPPDFKAVAIWYGDDGSCAKVATTYTPRICTAGFIGGYRGPLAWAESIFGVGNVSVYSKGTGAEVIAFIGTAKAKFFEEVSKWLPPSMQRKLPPEYKGRYIPWLKPGFQCGAVESVEPWEPTSKWHRRKNIRYCIEVDHPTHRYFTSGGLVSNSKRGPWKHLGSLSGEYRALDGVQTWRVMRGCFEELASARLSEVYLRHMHSYDVYVLKPAEEEGLGFSRERLTEFSKKMEEVCEGLDSQIQALVPESVRDNPLLMEGPYVREIRDSEGVSGEILRRDEATLIQACTTCGAQQVSKKHRCEDRELTPKVELVERVVPRWWRRKPFNPTSWQQVLAVILAKKHKPGKDRKSKADTTDKKTLMRLQKTGDPFYSLLLEHRRAKKMGGTYGEGMLERLDVLDRVHGYASHLPSTFRLSWVDPNLQNVASHVKYASEFRRAVVAAPGCKLLSFDYSGIEAVLVGYFSGDPDYIRLAKLGVHAYVESNMLYHVKREIGEPASLAWSDCDLRAHFKEIKERFPAEYDQSKRVVHGYNYGLTEYGLSDAYPDLFPKRALAKQLIDLYQAVCPRLAPWQAQVRELAHRQKYLGGPGAHPFGYKHWFFAVLSYRNVKGVWVEALGDDAKKAVAFYPQSAAAGTICEAALALLEPGSPNWIGDCGPGGRTPLRAIIHDDLTFEVRDEMADYVRAAVIAEMTRGIEEMPCPEEWGLGTHLTVGVAAKEGMNWAPYHPEGLCGEPNCEKKHSPNPDGMRGIESVADDSFYEEEDDEDSDA